jgi:hypothetical protein
MSTAPVSPAAAPPADPVQALMQDDQQQQQEQAQTYTVQTTSEATRAAAVLEVDPIVRRDAEVFAPFDSPLVVVTPPQKLTALDADLHTCHVDLSDSLRDFVDTLEDRVTNLVVANFAAWFPTPASAKKAGSQAADAIRERFKSFFSASGDYRFRLPADAQAFDEAGEETELAAIQPGARVRLVIEASRISFGKREYGVSIRVKQMRIARVPVCIIQDEDDAASDDGGFDDFV